MFRKKKPKKQTTDWGERIALTLSTEGGRPFITFPAPVVESLRYLLAHLNREDGIPRRLVLASALRQEGVTYLARALGTVMANDLLVDVCVVELNWWWWSALPPGIPQTSGLAGVLRGEATLDQVLVHTGRPNLHLLPSGRVNVINRPVLARSPRLKETIATLSERFDYLLLDIPALLATSDALPLVTLGDAACLVVRQGVTHIDRIQEAQEYLAQIPIAGVIMNQVDLATPDWLLKYIPQA